MDVAIFGAGIAGLMTAIALRAEGYRCRIYERFRQSHDNGMGFILMPTGIAYLKSFDVHRTGAMEGTLLHRYYCRDEAGRILHDEAMPAGARGFRRRDLIAAMMQVLRERALPENDTLIFDAGLDRVCFDEDRRVTEARLQSGAKVQADLYVAADGHRSRIRQALFPDWPESPAQVLEIVGMVRCHNIREWAGQNFNKFHSRGGGLAVGILPVDHDHVVWYVQFDARRFPPPAAMADIGSNAKHCREFLETMIGHWADPVRHLLAITDFSRVHLWQPMDTNLIPRFHQSNLVLVGDAAHPMLPFTSQGVSSAISDAAALSKSLSAYTIRSRAAGSEVARVRVDLDQALASYSAERYAQCSPYIDKGRELTRHFLSRVSSHTWLPIAL